MTRAKPGDTVKVHYKACLEDGTVFDASEADEPLEFVIGSGQMLPAFESAVVGMTPGDRKSQPVGSGEAYGPHRGELVAEVERAQIPPELNLQVGQRLRVTHSDGHESAVTVTGISDQAVTLDANHPLAGKDLLFDIELVEILAAA